MARYDPQELKLSSVRGDSPYNYRYRSADAELGVSVNRSGVLMPLIVTEEKHPVVIAGHKRFAAALAAGIETVPALVAAGLKPQDAFLLNLISNWRQEVPEMDRAKALGLAVRQFRFKPEEVREILMPLLGLPADQATLELYLKADAMPGALKDLFATGVLAFRGVTFLLKFSEADQTYFAKAVGSRVKLSSSQLLQTGEWLSDVMKREGKCLEALLKNHPVREVLDHPDIDPRTKADKFFAAVKWLRFPRYSAYLEAFEHRKADIIRDDKQWRLEPVEGFEEKGFELRARVKNAADLDAILKRLSESRSALNSLFDVML
ncbi:MAG TPA: ParB/RepB/Spo0J family partition protein [Candidatus Omnitrophota bacterium]|nr:ParB/RepB/Spo0J family partition protein [Candidatus Omnitrophota bacterium]HPS37452.1 ParB/RepB/Spo0J family partition protein [Candidatus Omnitrophota bacterium]